MPNRITYSALANVLPNQRLAIVHMLQSEARRVASEKYLRLCQRVNTNEFTEPLSNYKRSLRSKLKQLDKDEFDVIETSNNQLYWVAKLTTQ